MYHMYLDAPTSLHEKSWYLDSSNTLNKIDILISYGTFIVGDDMKRLPINLKDKQHEDLRNIAFKDKKSMSDIIRKAIDEYINKRNGHDKSST